MLTGIGCLLGAALLAHSAGGVPLPKPRPGNTLQAGTSQTVETKPAVAVPRPPIQSPRFALASTDSTSSADLAAVKEAIADHQRRTAKQ